MNTGTNTHHAFQPNHRPSVFTELNNRERFASLTTGRKSPANTAVEPTASTSFRTSNQSNDIIEGEWLLVGKHGKITAANRHKKEVLPVDIGSPCAAPSIPTVPTSSHWQIEVSFIPTSSQVVSVPKTMTAMLNHLQAIDPNTVIAPVHYKDAEEDEYIVTTMDIPVRETALDTYLVKYDNTRNGRIGLSIIIASQTTFNVFKQDKTLVQWFQAEKMSVLLDMIDVATPRQAGFFVRLIPKAESLDMHYERICTYLPEAPTFQLVSRILKTKHPGTGKDRYTTVAQAITDSEDCDELVDQLRYMCDNVAGYEFYPLEEFHCLEHSDKITLINRQIEFTRTYASLVVSGFEYEPQNFFMWMPTPSGDPAIPTIPTQATTNQNGPPATATPTGTEQPPSTPDNWEDRLTGDATDTPHVIDKSPEPMDFCDDRITTLETPFVTTKSELQNLTNQVIAETGHTTPVIDVETGITTDISTSNKRLRTINGRVSTTSTEVTPGIKSQPDMTLISVTQFLYTIQSGDGTPLFAFVYDPIDGQRELITSKYQEATRFVNSLHPYLVRRMNQAARDILYPNQTENIKKALQQPDWMPFRIFSQLAPLLPNDRNQLATSPTMPALTRVAPGRGRGGGRTFSSPNANQQHWYFSNRSASQQVIHQTSGDTMVTSTTTVQNEVFRYTPSNKRSTAFPPRTTKRPSSPPATNPVQISRVTMHQSITPSTNSELALNGLQERLESMTVRQQELEKTNAIAFQALETRMQTQLQESLSNSTANNAAIQADMARNKAEASHEMSATMQFLRMLNDNANTAKAQSELFQHTLLQRLDTLDITSQPNPAVAHAPNFNTGSVTSTTNSTSAASKMNTPAAAPLTLLRSNNTKRQQQQSILATMSKIGQQLQRGGTENEMSRQSTGHGLDGKTHRTDTSTLDPTHPT